MIKPFYVVLFTGSREWTRRRSVQSVVQGLMEARGNELAIVSGGAAGLDTIVEETCHNYGVPFARVDANWDYYHKAAGPIRNGWMLRLCCPREAHAFHSNLKNSKGTRDMVERCERAEIPVTVHRR